VLVIGAGGVLGSGVRQAFLESGWQAIAGVRHHDDSGESRLVDLDRPDTVRRAVEGLDLVVNAVPHTGLTAERAVLDLGGTLVNIAALPAAELFRLKRETQQGTPQGLAVMNAGLAPGVSSLVAADLVSAHPESDTIELAFTFSAAGSSGPSGGEFLLQHLRARRRHGTVKLPFPEPFGWRRCIEIAEEERGWLGAVAAGRDVHSYACLDNRLLQGGLLVMNALGLISRLPRRPFVRRRGAGTDLTHDPVSEWVAVLRSGRRMALRTIEGQGDYRMTAAATVVLAEALRDRLARGAATPGAYAVEELFGLDELEASLAERGIRIVRREPG
jgi:hypothetical protein